MCATFWHICVATHRYRFLYLYVADFYFDADPDLGEILSKFGIKPPDDEENIINPRDLT